MSNLENLSGGAVNTADGVGAAGLVGNANDEFVVGRSRGPGGDGCKADLGDTATATALDGDGDGKDTEAAPEAAEDDGAATPQEEEGEDEEEEEGFHDEAEDAGFAAQSGDGGCEVTCPVSAEDRLTERFGRVVASATRGSVLLELPLPSITRRRGHRHKAHKDTAITAGPSQATVLIVPLHGLHRGYAAACAALVSSRVAFLSSCKALSGLSQGDLSHLALAARPLWLAGGAVVVRQGDPVDALYLVQEGEIRLLDDPDGVVHHHHHHHHHHQHQHHQHQHHHIHHQHQQENHRHHLQTQTHRGHPCKTDAATRVSASSVLLSASLSEDPVMSSEIARSPWSVASHGHMYGHGYAYGHGAAAAAIVAGGGVSSDASAAQVQRSLAQLVPLMILEPGALLGESVLGCGPPLGSRESLELLPLLPQDPPQEEEESGSTAVADSAAHSGQLHLLHVPSPPPLLPAPPTALPGATTGRSPLQLRQSTHRISFATGATAATAATSDTSSPLESVASAPIPPSCKEKMASQTSAASLQKQVSQPDLEEVLPPPPPSQQQQQLYDSPYNHHKQMQHLHRLLTKQGQDHRLQQIDNHNHHGQQPTDSSNGEAVGNHATYGNTHGHGAPGRRASGVTPGGVSQPGLQQHMQHQRSTETQLGSPPPFTTTTSSSTSGGAVAAAADTTSPSSNAAVAAAASAEDAAAAAANAAVGAATPVNVFPATAVAVGAVRLLALPRKALQRLPQLQPVLAALASGQLRILEHRRRDAQEMRDRLEGATGAAGEAECAACPAGTASLTSTSPVKDPYAEARRRQSERRAAVGALNGNAAAVPQVPEVLPTDEMISRPSAALEKMGFKVPKVRGILAQSASSSVGAISSRRSPGSRRSSEHQPQLQQLDTPFHYSQPNSPITAAAAAAARMRSSTGELGFLDTLTSRSQSVNAGTLPRLPAVARVASTMAVSGGAAADVDSEGVSSPLPRGAAAASAAAAAIANGGGYLLGLDSPDRLRSSISMPERSGYSLTSRLSTALPRIVKGQVQSLRGSTGGSARGERSLCGVAPPSDPRSYSGSPIRRSPRVYDMDAYIASASGSRAGSASRSSRGRVGFEVPPDGDGAALSCKFPSAVAGVELIASAGSPRNHSLSGVVASGGATSGSTAATLAVLPPQVAAAALPPRTVSVTNLGRLCIPMAGLDEGTISRTRRTGSGAVSPVSTAPATLPIPPPPPSAATGWRPIRISHEDGRLPVLPSPQRPSRMFQEEAAAAAAALLRGHAGAGSAAGTAVPLVPTPPARPSGKAVLTDDATVSRWMEEHASGFVNGASGATPLRRAIPGQSASQQPLPPPSVIQKLSAVAAGSVSMESHLAAAAAAMKRSSGTGL
ncbi:hypothetical protein Vafri_16929 [Volvox africanus]|nr:hypothetical protein Vafri_16929 [Volvox africanus]